ncbi:MAG: DUF167 domain-containing protein [Gemmatimonadales bacterium]
MPPFDAAPGGTLIRLLVQPRASRSEVVGLHGDAVRVRLAAPPVDGAANDALTRLLAATLAHARSRISVRAGHSSRRKTVLVEGLEPGEVRERLLGPAR